jgi:predicted nucleic acid-binding protein
VRVLRRPGDTLVTAAQNAAEFGNVCTRPVSARGGYGLSIADADRRLRVIERLFQALPDRPASYQAWRRLIVAHAVQGVQVHDARLVALMQINGITHILTLNGSDFTRYPGIVPIAPTSLPPPPQTTP